MRLIDADAFKAYMRGALEQTRRCYPDGGEWAEAVTEEFCRDIDEQPTAQPECERGHWIEGRHRKFIDLANADRQYTELGYPHRTYINMSCSNCGMITIVDASIRYDFCPHCGADMKEV